MVEAVVRETRAEVAVELRDDLRRLAWLVEGSALLVSPDTGPLHIGRALGTPVVSLFGYTNPKRTGPYRAFEDLVVDGYAAYEGEPYPITSRYRDGMKRVTVERVLEKVALAMTKYVSTGA
jgi:heptosyltransferase I